MRPYIVLSAIGAIALAVLLSNNIRTQQPDNIFKGKSVTVYVGGPPGSGYDLYGRLFSRHVGRYLPGNPNVIVSNLPGSGGILCANFLYSIAPKDGTAVGLFLQTAAEEQVFETDGVQFDVTKFSWIGRMSSNIEISYTWNTVPVHTITDLMNRETLFAATGGSSIAFPQLLNKIIGTKFKVVRGYLGTPAANLAMQRGEVEGATSSLDTIRLAHPEWLEDKTVNVLVQYALHRNRVLPDVPAVVELASAPEDRSILSFFASSSDIGRSIAAPPDISQVILKTWRTAFDNTMRDPAFIGETQQMKVDLDSLSGEELQKIVQMTVNISAADRERARTVRAP